MNIGYDPYLGTFEHFDAVGIISAVGRAGYGAINIPMRPEFLNRKDEDASRKVFALTRDAGLATPSIGMSPHTWSEPGASAETMKTFEYALKMAAAFQAKNLTLWPRLPSGVSIEAAQAALEENLRASLPIAKEAGLEIAIEFEKGSAIDNYRDAIAFGRRTGLPVKWIADTYHLYNDGANMREAIRALGKSLAEAHLSGSHRGEPGSSGDRVDYDGFMRGLDDVGFSGPLFVQFKLVEKESVVNALRFSQSLFGVNA